MFPSLRAQKMRKPAWLARFQRNRLFLQRLDERIVPATATLSAGVLTVNYTQSSGTETVTFSNDGTNITLTGVVSGATSNPTASVNKIVLQDSGGSTSQSATFSGSSTWTLSEGLSSTGVESVVVSTAIKATGTGTISITAPRNILLFAGLTTADGDITLSANQQATPTSGNFIGIYVNNASVNSTNGAITLQGRGGTDSVLGGQIGVAVIGAVGTTTTGKVSVQGTGGKSSAGTAFGVYVFGNSTIGSNGGAVSVTGQGGGTTTADSNYGVSVDSGALITAGGAGAVSVQGTGGAASGFQNFGVAVSTNSKITSSGGTVTVTGKGGGTGTSDTNYGVFVLSKSTITAGGSASVKVEGTGGSASGSFNWGVVVTGSGASDASTITSNGGDVTIIGQGGGLGNSANNHGVVVDSHNTITAGGSGSVSVQGTGGADTGGFNYGVNVSGRITSGGGPVNVVGVAGGKSTSGQDIGVIVSSGQITAGGTGTVSVQGTGATSTGTFNIGISVSGTTGAITSSGGAVTVTATGGNSTSEAIRLISSGTISSGGTAPLSIVADSLNLTGTSTIRAGATGNATVTIAPRTGGTKINIGGADVLTGSPLTLGLTTAELDRVFAGKVIIGADGSLAYPGSVAGTVVVATSIQHANDANFVVVSPTNVVIFGWTSISGNLTFLANQQATPTSGTAQGISVGHEIKSTSGAITLQGRGGSSNTLAELQPGVVISGPVGSTTGAVTIIGVGGLSGANNNWGVSVVRTGQITSNGGNIVVTGQGGGTFFSLANYGVAVSGLIKAGGGGSVTVTGTGGTTDGFGNSGVYVYQDGSTKGAIASSGGAVTVSGQGGGGTGNCNGILVSGASISAGGTGTMTLVGYGATNTKDLHYGVALSGLGSITSSGGDISITGSGTLDAVSVYGTIAPGGTSKLTVMANGSFKQDNGVISSSTDITLSSSGPIIQNGGTIQTSGALILNAPGQTATFNFIGNKAAQLVIPANVTCLVNGSFDSTGFVQVNGTLGGSGSVGTVTVLGTGKVAPGNSPGKLSTGNIAFNSSTTFTAELNGTAIGSGYDQLAITGTVDLGGAKLQPVLGYIPALNQVFTIIDNDTSGDAVTGPFNGLPEGATTTFGGYNFGISYQGGDGNDVTLKVLSHAAPVVLTSVVFGDGSNQRSMVKQIVVNFSEIVNFSGPVVNAFTLGRSAASKSAGPNANVALTANPVTGPASSVTITFSGALTESAGSLVDGLYDFTIDAAQISGVAGNLDGDGNGIGGDNYAVAGSTANKFFRLFGDSNGDGALTQDPDFFAFRNAFGGPSTVFDFDNSGAVDQLDDFIKFRSNFGGEP